MNTASIAVSGQDVLPKARQIENPERWGDYSRTDFTSLVLQQAIRCIDQGLSVIPIRPKEKAPNLKELKPFLHSNAARTQVLEWFSASDKCLNIGVVCGRISGNLVVVDFDVADAIDLHREWIENVRGKTLIVKTSRGLHVFLRTQEPVRSRRFDGGEIRAEGQYVVFPPSLHPEGKHYQREPLSREDQILLIDSYELPMITLEPIHPQGPAPKFLQPTVTHGLFAIAEGRSRIPTAVLSPEFRHLFQHNDLLPESKYQSRSEAEFALVVKLVHGGYSADDIYDFFEAHAHPRSHYMLTSGSEERKNAIVQADRKAQRYLEKERMRSEAAAEVLQKVLQCPRLPLQGRARGTDSAVLRCVISKALERRIFKNLAVPIRETAERAGLARTTVHNSLRRLAGAGLLEHVSSDTSTGNAGLFSLNIAALRHLYHNDRGGEVSQICNSDMTHDVFRHRALGKNGYAVFALLGIEPGQTIKEIANKTGLSYTSVYRKLQQMARTGIIEATKKRYRIRERCNLDTAAEKLGTAGNGEVQKAFHNMERKAHIHRVMTQSGEMVNGATPDEAMNNFEIAKREYNRAKQERKKGLQCQRGPATSKPHKAERRIRSSKEA